MSGWGGDGLYLCCVLPGSFGSLTLLAVLDPGCDITVEAAPHNPGGDEPLGGLHAGMG